MIAHRVLKILIAFIGIYHLLIGFGLMFSPDFQKFCVAAYGASFEWNIRDTYYIRIIGSFVFVLGSLALAASTNPLRYWIFLVCYIEFFILRDIHRHLYSEEIYAGFAITPFINLMTSVIFAVQAISIGVLASLAQRQKGR
jgi:hypothetical protein